MSNDSYGTSASLTITGEGSLDVSGSFYGIYVKSGSGDASLTIEEASVNVNTTLSYGNNHGVHVMSGTYATSSPVLSLAVNGGSLTTSGSASGEGIKFYVGASGANSATTSLTVTGNAIVDARTGGISATGVNITPEFNIGSTDSIGGIVWNGAEGTVYGNVTLDEPLTIDQDETLTIPQGSTLNGNSNLTNNGTIVDAGGTLTGEPGGIIVTAPAIITESLPEGMAGQPYTATLEATGNNITWSVTEGTLPEGLTLNESTGEITGTPATEGQFPFTVIATNSAGIATKQYTLNIKPATVSVTGLKLDKDSLTLQEKGSDTLTATVEPADATNKAVTWKSSDTNIATVSEDGTVTAISAGNATITAAAADGSGVSASCKLTVTHGNMVQTPKKDATCTVDGTEEYWTCEICGKHYKDESGTISTTPEDNVIPATGHNYGEPEWSWSKDGKTCTVTFTCANDETHKETPELTVISAVKTPATCTEKGVTTYTAAVEFNGQTYTDTKDMADIPATGHKLTKTEAKAPTVTAAGNKEYWTCETCKKHFSNAAATMEISLKDTTISMLPSITQGAGSSWQKGSVDGLTITSNAAYAEFIKVQVDGQDLDAANYTVKEGSTIVTVKSAWLETLEAGEHTLSIVSKSGTASARFTVQAVPTVTDNADYYNCPACGHHNWTAGDTGYRCDYCGYLETVKQLSGYDNVKGLYTPVTNSAENSNGVTSANTGDESNLILCAALFVASSVALIGLNRIRRKPD